MYGGEGSPWAPPYVTAQAPSLHMKEDWVQGAPHLSHIQTSYAGTKGFMRHRARLPATIVIARGLLSPMPWFWRRFTAVGERVKQILSVLYIFINILRSLVVLANIMPIAIENRVVFAN